MSLCDMPSKPCFYGMRATSGQSFYHPEGPSHPEYKSLEGLAGLNMYDRCQNR